MPKNLTFREKEDGRVLNSRLFNWSFVLHVTHNGSNLVGRVSDKEEVLGSIPRTLKLKESGILNYL
eukprot:c29976_g1_i1 orf=1-195(-)